MGKWDFGKVAFRESRIWGKWDLRKWDLGKLGFGETGIWGKVEFGENGIWGKKEVRCGEVGFWKSVKILF